MDKFKIITLGCKVNQYESQALREQLIGLGLKEISRDVDVCIVNSCMVTHKAEAASRNRIRKVIRENPRAKIVVTGCFSENLWRTLQKSSREIQYIPADEKENLIEKVFSKKGGDFSISQFSRHTRAFVKIQDGCPNFCSYCIIPYVRKKVRSRRVEDIVCEVRKLVGNGYREIVLTGINIGEFKIENRRGLVYLLQEMDKIREVKRVRISSINPNYLDKELCDTILSSEKMMPSLHISLQSAANNILKRMNRKYTVEVFLEIVDYFRKNNPDFTFTSDIIVGFPGEMDADFRKTLDVVFSVGFAKVHIFPYSRREKTEACNFLDHIPKDVIDERKEELSKVSEQGAFVLRNTFLERTMEVLFEERRGSCIKGYTPNYLPVKIFQREGIDRGSCKQVKLIENSKDGFIGQIYAD